MSSLTGTITKDEKFCQRIKVDADSRNIEELVVEPDPKEYSPRKTPEEIAKMESNGFTFSDYEGMMSTMENQTLIIDDISQAETERMIEIYKPAIFCAGIKEKYAVQKTGTPMLQLHSYDYGGPFAVFKGAINFYKTIDRMVNAKIWGYVKPPWKTKVSPVLEAALVSES